MKLSPYLVFNSQAKEAVDFYASCLGGEVAGHLKFSDMPEHERGNLTGDQLELTAHVLLHFGDQSIMAADHPWSELPPASGFNIQTEWNSHVEAEAAFSKLGEGGSVLMPLGKTSWAQACGMIKDKFGVQWIVNYTGVK